MAGLSNPFGPIVGSSVSLDSMGIWSGLSSGMTWGSFVQISPWRNPGFKGIVGEIREWKRGLSECIIFPNLRWGVVMFDSSHVYLTEVVCRKPTRGYLMQGTQI